MAKSRPYFNNLVRFTAINEESLVIIVSNINSNEESKLSVEQLKTAYEINVVIFGYEGKETRRVLRMLSEIVRDSWDFELHHYVLLKIIASGANSIERKIHIDKLRACQYALE